MIAAMPDTAERARPDSVVVCLPDVPERVHMGELPANVDVRLVPPEPEPVPDLAEVELIVPIARAASAADVRLTQTRCRGSSVWSSTSTTRR